MLKSPPGFILFGIYLHVDRKYKLAYTSRVTSMRLNFGNRFHLAKFYIPGSHLSTWITIQRKICVEQKWKKKRIFYLQDTTCICILDSIYW